MTARPFTPALVALASMLGACLYIGGRNEAPAGEVELVSASSRLHQYGNATLRSLAEDPNDDALIYAWRVWGTDEAGKSFSLTQAAGPLKDSGAPTNVSRSAAGVIWRGQTLALTQLPLRGAYTAEVRVRDDQGAEMVATRTFKVDNQPPSGLKLQVTGDPLYPGDEVDVAAGKTPVHAHYLVGFDTASVVDVEGDLLCGRGFSVSWILTPTPASAAPKLLYKQERPCQGKEVLTRLRFRYDAPDKDPIPRLEVTARVDDGHGGTATAAATLKLVGNRAPCILATEPDFTTQIPRLAAQSMRFEVVAVDDDVPETTYIWSLEQGKQLAVQPGQRESVLTLEPWAAGTPGSETRVRVEVRDRQGRAAACPADQALCAPDSKNKSPKDCYRWVTWKVKLL